MFARAARRKQVHDALAPRRQPVSDVAAVAVVGIAFGAHDADRFGARLERGRRRAEGRRLHVLLVRHVAIPAESLAVPFVPNTRLAQSSDERFARKLRVATRDGESAHVDQRAHFRLLKDDNELGRAARAVTDGEDQAAFAAF